MSGITCIRNAAWAVAWEGTTQRHVYLQGADIAFDADGIRHVGNRFEGTDLREIDGSRLMVMPGLVNIHSHPSSEPLNKGLMDELGSRKLGMSGLYEFMPIFRGDHDSNRAAAEVALCELLMSGVTTLVDLSVAYPGWLDLLGQSGMRAVAAPMFRSARWFTRDGHSVEYEWDEAAGERAMADALSLADQANGHNSGRLTAMVSPSQVDTCSPELLKSAHAQARARKMSFQIHAAQAVVEFNEMTRRHGMTPIEWLNSLGVLGAQSIIGHAIFVDEHPWLKWPDERDLEILASTGTTVAHCPTVFSRRGIMLHDIGRYRRAGVNLGIGTDTFPHNMIEEMRTASIVAKLAAGDVGTISLEQVFEMATVGGAKALGRDDIGRLAPGCKADLVLVDLDHWAMRPLRDPLKSLVFSAGERPIRDVFIDGQQVVTKGRVITLDHADALDRLEAGQRRAMARTPKVDWAERTVDQASPLAFALKPASDLPA